MVGEFGRPPPKDILQSSEEYSSPPFIVFPGDAVFASGETIKVDRVVDGSGKMSL
jgi:hypothetical protein